jgi:hypothetical protein
VVSADCKGFASASFAQVSDASLLLPAPLFAVIAGMWFRESTPVRPGMIYLRCGVEWQMWLPPSITLSLYAVALSPVGRRSHEVVDPRLTVSQERGRGVSCL